MKLTSLILPSLLLGGAALLLAPAPKTYGFTTFGFSLGAAGQRDWRLFNDFSDPQTNNNTVITSDFPGWDGAELTFWKAAAEWGAVLHGGNGAGDPIQNVGNGGANFDFVFAGVASSQGTSTQNIMSATGSCSPGVFAFIESPASNGWRGQYCDNQWVWSDGPGAPGGNTIDLQAIATHEFGHCLGLGHSLTNNATMFASATGGTAPRSIHTDDQNGVQAIYGSASGTKCEITGVTVDLGANTVTVNGLNFSGSNNQAWITNANVTSSGSEPKVIVSSLNSTGGGTQIVLTLPGNASSGDIHIKNNAGGHSSLSNGWPLDLSIDAPDPLTVTSIIPATVDALQVGTEHTVTVTGTGFSVDDDVRINFLPLAAANFTVVDDTTITIDLPQLATLGLQTISVDNGVENDSDSFTVVANSDLTLQCGNGNPLNTVSGSFDTTTAGNIGELHYVLYSNSNQPSPSGVVTLDIGNFFTDLFLLDTFVIGPSGWTQKNFPLPAITADFFMQSITLDQGFPIPTSNVSSIHIIP